MNSEKTSNDNPFNTYLHKPTHLFDIPSPLSNLSAVKWL